MTAAAELLGWTQAAFWHATLVFLRVGAAMALMPGFSEQSVPMRIRLGLAIAFTMIVAPAIDPLAPTSPWDFATFLRFVMTESVAGLALGIGLRLFVIALQTAGAMAAQATSLSQIAGNAAEPMPAFGHLLVIGGLALAMMMGLHVAAAEYLIGSYQVFIPGTFPAPSDLSRWGIDGVAKAFALAFTLAMPFVITSVIYNVTLGVINRAMPQLMVAFVGAPVITFGGLALLFLLAPTMLIIWRDAFFAFLATPFGGVR